MPFRRTVCWFACRYRSLIARKLRMLASSRVNAWTIRMPAMSSASVAVTSPSRSRTWLYARAE